MLGEPHDGSTHPPEIFCRLIDHLMSPADAMNGGRDRPKALAQLNAVLEREGFDAFYGEDGSLHSAGVTSSGSRACSGTGSTDSGYAAQASWGRSLG